jgi:hypothetical protein
VSELYSKKPDKIIFQTLFSFGSELWVKARQNYLPDALFFWETLIVKSQTKSSQKIFLTIKMETATETGAETATQASTLATLKSTVTESLIFNVVLFIAVGFILGVLIANAFYFNRIRGTGCMGSISSNEATIMFWLNVALAIVAAIIWLWSIYRLFVIFRTREFSEKASLQSAAQTAQTIPARSRAAGAAFATTPARSPAQAAADVNEARNAAVARTVAATKS